MKSCSTEVTTIGIDEDPPQPTNYAQAVELVVREMCAFATVVELKNDSIVLMAKKHLGTVVVTRVGGSASEMGPIVKLVAIYYAILPLQADRAPLGAGVNRAAEEMAPGMFTYWHDPETSIGQARLILAEEAAIQALTTAIGYSRKNRVPVFWLIRDFIEMASGPLTPD